MSEIILSNGNYYWLRYKKAPKLYVVGFFSNFLWSIGPYQDGLTTKELNETIDVICHIPTPNRREEDYHE